MRRRVQTSLFALCCWVEAATAARIPLSDKALPFLSIDSAGAGLLRWDSAPVLDAVQGAAMVEVSPRGLRFVGYPTEPTFFGFDRVSPDAFLQWRTRPLAVASDGGCVAARGCLCATQEGQLLPSLAPGDVNISGTTLPVGAHRLQSAVLRAFAAASGDACGYNGAGRTIVATAAPAAAVYTVSGCDALQGHLVVLYTPSTEELLLFKQTLGPMAYTASIVVRLLYFYFGLALFFC